MRAGLVEVREVWGEAHEHPKVLVIGPFGIVLESPRTSRRYFVAFNQVGGEECVDVTEGEKP
jgi:hypothetical protein